MGHIGLTPQSVHALGGYRIQGKTASARESIIQDAIALEDAGVYALVLEGIPAELVAHVIPLLAWDPVAEHATFALAKVVEKLPGPLSEEFRRALAEIRVGRTRREALRDIVGRTEVAPLTNFIGAIIQAEQLGVSISKVLQVQSEQLRIERRQRAEEQAAKAPIKMLFPLVGCIFPSLFIVILGPAVLLIAQGLSGF